MESTVLAILAGGLGNQLFQYAAARALAARVRGKLLLDLSEFPRDSAYKRVYLLDQFPITATPMRRTYLSPMWWALDRGVRRFPRFAARLGRLDEPRVAGKEVLDPRLLQPPRLPNLSLRGYWQNEDYFREHGPLIRDELTPPVPTDSVALAELERIRRSSHPVAVGIRFFEETIGEPEPVLAAYRHQLRKHALANPGCDYFVFSNAPQLVRSGDALGVPFCLMTDRPRNEDAPMDLFLMTQCRTFFVGYSSFHWWGAWLAPCPDKRVTYLHFPGRPCQGYAAKGWNIAPVATA